jgi:hypothetical protein
VKAGLTIEQHVNEDEGTFLYALHFYMPYNLYLNISICLTIGSGIEDDAGSIHDASDGSECSEAAALPLKKRPVKQACKKAI